MTIGSVGGAWGTGTLDMISGSQMTAAKM